MSALFVRATGDTFMHPNAQAYFVRCEGRWYRHAAVAHDQNTTADGQQLEGADGPPNAVCVVYVEIPQPKFAGAEMRVIDIEGPVQKESEGR